MVTRLDYYKSVVLIIKKLQMRHIVENILKLYKKYL